MAGIQGEAAGPVYPKIPTVWKRNRDTGKIRLGDYAMPELEYLHQNVWWCFEKIDGTNIRLHWDGEQVLIGGRTNNAQIPAPLFAWLQTHIPAKQVWAEKFDGPVTLYGEGFGRGIQNGTLYGDTRFIVFDVLVEHWWLHWDDVTEIASALGFETVPFLGEASIDRAVHIVRNGELKSRWPHVVPEGLVLRPRVELQTRRGQRLLTKIKWCDYT